MDTAWTFAVSVVWPCCYQLCRGIIDSWRLGAVVDLARRSSEFRRLLSDCFLLNICLFVGGHWWQELAMRAVAWVLDIQEPNDLPWTLRTLSWAQWLCWYAPMYALCFGYNLVWCRAVARCAASSGARAPTDSERATELVSADRHSNSHHLFLHPRHQQPHQRQQHSRPFQRANESLMAVRRAWLSLLQFLSEEVYRAMLSLALLVQMKALSWIPMVGYPLHMLHLSWFYALSSFEYAWCLNSRGLAERIRLLETDWIYYTGFGLTQTLLTTVFPKFLASGVFAFVLPLFIVLAVHHARAHNVKAAACNARLPIFAPVTYALSISLRALAWLAERRKASKQRYVS